MRNSGQGNQADQCGLALRPFTMAHVICLEVLKALAYPMNGALLGGLDWVFTALSMWVAGASGVVALCLCKRMGFVVTGGTGLTAAVSGLHSIWLGFSMFFGMQVASATSSL